MEKAKREIIYFFYILFSVCFTFIVINSIFNNPSYKIPYLVIVIPFCLAGLFVIYRGLDKFGEFTRKNYKNILIVFDAAMFITEMVFGIMLRHGVAWDIGAVNNGAAEWVETGTFESYYQYFYGCPNNRAPMAFYYIFFKLASFFGVKDYYVVAVLIDSVMITSVMVLASLICSTLSEGAEKTGVFALILFAVSAPYWFAAAVNYTDFMSILFPVLSYWLYLKAKRKQGKRQILMYILTGLALAVGSMIKFTVFVMAVALFIDMCLDNRGSLKKIARFSVCVFGVIIIIMTSFSGYIYAKHLDRKLNEYYHRPYSHWMMMGLRGEGRYNPEDFTFTDETPAAERKEKINEELIRRIKERGFFGLFKLSARKSAIDFGDGTYGLGDYLYYEPIEETSLHDWVLDSGANYSFYSHYSTSIHISIMILMVLAVYCLTIKRGEDDNRKKLFAFCLALFGLWLFLMCWESSRRYFINFGPVIIICGAIGMDMITRMFPEIAGDVKNKMTKIIGGKTTNK